MATERRAVLCGSCRQLISNREKRCPHCGALRPDSFGLGGKLWAFFRDDVDPTMLLIGLCGLIYVLAIVRNPAAALDTSNLLSIGSPSCDAMALLGITSGPRMWAGHGWTLLTAGVLHLSLLHIAFNLYFLRSFGAKAHGLLGPARTLVLFFLSSIGGFLLSDLLSGAPTAGASAGLFGLLGGMAVFGYRRGGTLGAALKREMLMTAGMVTLYSLFMGGVNHWAHGGGMAAGALIALGFPKHEGRHEGRGVQLLAAALTLATITAVFFNVWHTLQGSRLSQMCG